MKTNKLINYIKGLRKGKDAHRVELDAMRDPFLSDALEGFDTVKGDHAKRIEQMSRYVHSQTDKQGSSKVVWRILAACMVLGAIVSGGYYAMLKEKTSQVQYAESQESETLEIYIPEAYAEKKKQEIEEGGVAKQKHLLLLASNIVNLEDVLIPVQTIDIYLPKVYIQKKKKQDVKPRVSNIENLEEIIK